MDPKARNLLFWAASGAVLVAGAALRLASINEKSLWFDEAFSITLADHSSLAEVLDGCRRTEHPPLYQMILHYLLKLGAGPTALRVINVAIGMIAVLVAFALGAELRDRWSGLFAAAGTALSPLAVHFSQEIRMYSLFLLFSYLQMLLALRWTRIWKIREAALFGVVSALSVLSHYYALFPTLGLILFVGIAGWRNNAKLWSQIGISTGAGLFLFSFWLRSFIGHILQGGPSHEFRETHHYNYADVYNFVRTFFFGDIPVGPYTYAIHSTWDVFLLESAIYLAVALPLIAAGIGGLFGKHNGGDTKRSSHAGLFILCALALPLILTIVYVAIGGRWYVRYMMIFIPLIFFLMGEGIRRVPRSQFRLALVAFVFLYTAPASFILAQRDNRDLTLPTAKWLQNRLRTGDVIIHTNLWSYLPLKIYLPQEAEQYLLDREHNPHFIFSVVPEERKIDEVPPPNRGRIWLVVSRWAAEVEEPAMDEVETRLRADGWKYRGGEFYRQPFKWTMIKLYSK